MNPTISLLATTLFLLSFSSCAAPTPNDGSKSMQAPSSQHVALPRSAGDGTSKKEVSVHIDERHLKLATIALRDGTSLPPHTAPVPVTIHVLEGEGVIHTSGKPVSVTQGSLVTLVANEEHDVIPTSGSDMLLLVHYLRGAQ